MALNRETVSCKKLAKVFEALTKHPYELVAFTRNILGSEYKFGLENEYLIYYSQGVEYYYECFEEWFPEMTQTEVQYDGRRLYWLGYLFQHWYIKKGITGEMLGTMLTDEMIHKLYDLWDIYHTQDLEYVWEDLFE
ncbi:MAG: hypothetical protein ACRCTE_13840 [Cellulosilyticaceae bacterium]